ncbi:hypothetical protein [Nostoc sp. 2RC]|uniref:hypothetical protein n=1 Tax=Nostoc sp. 2RC TaxID=2485484 RepID=UPI0016253512|nr:hypothetical protein [Nostoc sp. 2RC]MBC1238348.1 hypothetical protein [Nostoc sp. 2RC]
MSEETSDIILDTPKSVSKWAPIIYGRTYAVDFRFLVIPHDFDDKIKDELWEYIKVTTRGAENLPGNPRWIFIRSKKRCVVGVTCMVRDLIGSQANITPEDLTRDKLGRPLYAFVGYVSQDSTITDAPAMNLQLFAKPYKEFVPQKWQEIYADIGRNQADAHELKSQYDREFTLEELPNQDLEAKNISIEHLLPNSQDSIIFWNISDAKNIWFTASNNREFLALCFGNFIKKDLLSSQFINAVIDEVEVREEIGKQIDFNSQPENLTYISPPQYGNKQVHQSGRVGQFEIHPQQVGDDINLEIDLEVENIVSASKQARNFIKDTIGEGAANTFDFIMRNTAGRVAEFKYGNETVDKMYEQIVGVDEETKLRKYIDEVSEIIKQLREKRKDLMKEGRENEAHELTRNIKILQYQIEDTKRELANIKHYRSRRTDQSTQPRQTEKRFAADPNFGFKEKEITENKQIDSEPNTKKIVQSKDPWEL